jgi:hypothetical protein
MDKQHYGGRGATMPLLPLMKNNNQLMRSGWMSNDDGMRWRTVAAEETRRMEKQQWRCNRQATMMVEGQ